MVKVDDRILTKQETVEVIKDRDGWLCAICLEEFDIDSEVTIDHWIPLSKGGTWHIDNLKLAHKICNTKKGNRIPNEDGTLPPLKRELKAQQKAVARDMRPEICDTCMSGRILLPGEFCDDCGSGAQPAFAPKALQVSPKECDHKTNHCWLCYLGFVQRTSAIITVLDGEYLHGE